MADIERVGPPRVDGPAISQSYAGAAAHRADLPVPVSEFLAPVRRRWPLILLSAVLGLGAALGIAGIQDPVYEAKALIEIQGYNNDFLNARSVDPNLPELDVNPYLQTQMKLLERGPLVERVALRLRADRRPEFQRGRSLPLLGDAFQRGPQTPVSRQALVDRVASWLTVRALGTSRIVELSYVSRDPAFACEFVNSLAGEFLTYSTDSRLESARAVAQGLSGQLQELKANLERSERELQSYARHAGLVFTSERDSAAEGRLKQLQDALIRAQDARVQEQAKYERVLSSPADALPEVLDDATLRNYQVKLTELRQQAADLSSVLKPAHYRVKQVQAQIEALQSAIESHRANILRRLKTQYEGARERENMLVQYYQKQTGVVSEEAARAVRYNVLRREVETNRQLYDAMLQRVKEAGIASAVRAANVRLVARAEAPDAPIRPKPSIYALAGLLSGALAGIVFAFTRSEREAIIRRPGDATVHLSLPELAAIPDAGKCVTRSNGRQNGNGNGRGNQDVQLVSWRDPYSPMAESFRSAATSVLFSAPASAHRIVAVTSACAGEGKTTVSVNLAIAMAAAAQRVLLIDGDIRKPSLHRIFALNNTRGLSDLLHDGREYLPFECGCWTDVPGLTVLPSGPKLADAGSLLHSRAMPQLLEGLRQLFDVIIIDTAPMALSEARVLGRLADGVVLVVRADRTSAESASAALLRLTEDGSRVLGTIVNHWNPKRWPSGVYASYLYNMPHGYFKV